MGEICPRSDPDIAHMGYYLDPLQLTHKGVQIYLSLCSNWRMDGWVRANSNVVRI